MILAPTPASPASPPVRGDAAPMQLPERARYRAAALHARRLHPGPLGELVFRELIAYAEFGYRLDNDGLIPRLAAALLATPLGPRPPAPGPT